MKSMAAHSQPGAFKTAVGCIGKVVVWLLVVTAFPLVRQVQAADAPKAPVAATRPKTAAFLDWTHYLKLAEDGEWDAFGKLDGRAFQAHFWPQLKEPAFATNAAYQFICGSGLLNWAQRQSQLSPDERQAYFRVAFPVVRQAAELGHPWAASELAWMLADGLGTATNAPAAVEWGGRAWSRTVERHGTNSLATARMAYDLAQGVYLRIGQSAAAEPLFRQALEIREKLLGPEHRDTVAGRNQLAGLYNSKGDYAKAEPLLRKRMEVQGRLTGTNDVTYAGQVRDLAHCLFRQTNYAGAAFLYREELVIQKQVAGERHPDFAWACYNLGEAHRMLKEHAIAEPFFRLAAEVFKVAGPDQSGSLATALAGHAQTLVGLRSHDQAEVAFREMLVASKKAYGATNGNYLEALELVMNHHHGTGMSKKAIPYAAERVTIMESPESGYGPEHLTTAASLNDLANLYFFTADYSRAEPLHERALKIREKMLGPEHAGTGQSLNNLAMLYETKGDYAKAEPLFERALRISEKVFGPEHPETATSLNNLALVYQAAAEYAKAKLLYERALEIYEKMLGPDHPDTALSLNNLAALYQLTGDYAKAEPLLARAVKIMEKVLGPEHSNTATSLNNLAQLYQLTGDFAKAEPLLVRAVKIMEKVLGPEHTSTAMSLNNLAQLYTAMADYAKAEPLHERALKIREKALGPDHAATALVLNDLAGLYYAMHDYARAEPLYERALKIFEKVLGPEHPETATCLGNLALLYEVKADYSRAEPLHERALKIREKVFGPEHRAVTTSLHNLAVHYRSKGDYAKAEPLFARMLKIMEKVLGPEHPDAAAGLKNLAGLHDAKGEFTQAEALLRRGIGILHRNLDRTAAVQSERQQLAMADAARSSFDRWFSVSLRAGRAPAELAEVELMWKGQIAARQQALRQLRSVLQRSGDPAVRALFERLDETSRSLATLALGQAEPGPKAEKRLKRLAELTEQKEALERDLSRQSALFRQQQQQANLTLADLQAALARRPGTVLVDFLEYGHMNQPKPGQHTNTFENRLLAFVVRGNMPEVALLELGLAAPLGALVDQWRKGLGAGQESVEAGRQLRAQVWEKLEPKLGGAKTVLLSLDGALSRLPFGALPGAKAGTYLLEEYSLATLPIPRLLPQLLEVTTGPRTNATPSLLAVGDVDYGGDPGAPMLAGTFVQRSADRRGQVPYPPLSQTRDEVLAVRDSFEQRFAGARVELSRKGQATEQRVRELAPQFQYLHLATHGFFRPAAPESPADATARLGGPDLFGRHDVKVWNPGLASGLALAGANQEAQAGKDDGILTAVEVESLDLRGVELAVLSACETGLGKNASGEGVLGLQRAFQLAGARTTVTSLWKVPDAATQTLMSEFYRRLWENKEGRLEALRGAQLWMLKEGKKRGVKLDGPDDSATGTLPPVVWAAFVLSGDWR